MIFLIITHVLHKKSGNKYYAYGPYVREMNLWVRQVEKVIIVAPLHKDGLPGEIDIPYSHANISFLTVPQFNIMSLRAILKTIIDLPRIVITVLRSISRADHIHLRCPGNVGFIGCVAQIFFPRKKKTAKYASNWDWESRQPRSYRLQQRILRNTLLTRNMTTLVYGDWPDLTKNTKPFFTASYSEKDRLPASKNPLNQGVKLAFVGTLTENKSPVTSLEVLKGLVAKDINATLVYCGDGAQRSLLASRISEYGLKDQVSMRGNVDSETVRSVLQNAHFLIFISRSEGWPKAVTEAMWWGCIPVTTPVSCVPWMLGHGERGELVSGDVSEIVSSIRHFINDQALYESKSLKAMEWSREYTIERFETEIKNFL